MPAQDRVVSIYPYFRILEGKTDQVKQFCNQFLSKAASEPSCVYYGFSFNGDQVHCREAYDGAEGVLAHLSSVGALLQEFLEVTELTRLELHGSAEELAKLRGPLAAFNPTYFTLEYAFRRN